jgi:hypothetical protein
MVVVMSVGMVVAVAMPVFVGMAADFHIAAAKTASAFFAHKFRFTTKYTKHTKRFAKQAEIAIAAFSFVSFRVFRGC